MLSIYKNSIKALIFAGIIGILAGFTNGFLGAGGGIILLFGLKRLNPSKGPGAVRDNFAAVVAIILLLSCISAVTYSHENSFDTTALASLAIPGAVGGIAGAYLTDRLNTSVLKTVFSVIIIIAGINMIL